MWFERLTGFKEENPDQVREHLRIEGEVLTSLVNQHAYRFGKLEIPSLADLKYRAPDPKSFKEELRVSESVGNVQRFHADPENAGALFQAASQFNLLEMTSPFGIPEEGVGIYEHDHTQGPACAIACGAGTIFRNYFVKVNGEIGQTVDNQIDCLADIGEALGNHGQALWVMKNGYALPDQDSLVEISRDLEALSPREYLELKDKLRIGVVWNTEVTITNAQQLVSQAYCSALPVSYTNIPDEYWRDFACLVLEGLYEATLYAGLLNYQQTGNPRVFLTLVGGGAFGNRSSWIMRALKDALELFRETPLDVRIVSYGSSNVRVRELVEEF